MSKIPRGQAFADRVRVAHRRSPRSEGREKVARPLQGCKPAVKKGTGGSDFSGTAGRMGGWVNFNGAFGRYRLRRSFRFWRFNFVFWRASRVFWRVSRVF